MPIKVPFNNYVYFGNPKDDNAYEFNESVFDTYISNRQYIDAANYLKQFKFNDPEVNKAHEADIYNIEHEGRKLAAIYSRITNSEDMDAIDFYDKLFVDGGLEIVENTNNEYKKEFIKLKQKLGSQFEYNLFDVNKAYYNDDIGFEFKPSKQTLFGIDWLEKDNPNTIDNFYNVSGLNKTMLQSKGVKVITKKDGSTVIRFKKDNPLANEIIYHTANINANKGPKYSDMPIHSPFINTRVIAYKPDGREVGTWRHSWEAISNLINKAKNTKDAFFKKEGLNSFTSPILMMGDVSPQLKHISELHDNGKLGDTEYKAYRDKYLSKYDNVIYALSGANTPMYANWGEEGYDENRDETLVPINNTKTRQKLIEHIKGFPSKVSYQFAMLNDQLGILISVAPTNLTKNSTTPGATQVFIPNLFTTEAQERLNSDTRFKAINELNSMANYGYEYKTVDDYRIVPTGSGQFNVYAGNTLIKSDIEKSQAIEYLNKSFAMEDIARNFKYDYIGADGNFIKGQEQQFINDAKRSAVFIANSIYKTTSDITEKDLFEDQNFMRTPAEANHLQYEKYKKIQHAWDIYSYILNSVLYLK